MISRIPTPAAEGYLEVSICTTIKRPSFLAKALAAEGASEAGMLNWIRSSFPGIRTSIRGQLDGRLLAELPVSANEIPDWKPTGQVCHSAEQAADSMLFSVSGPSAHRNTARNRQARWENIIDDTDPDRIGGAFFRPVLHPKFTFPEGASIFTIGSCFAEHVQYALTQQGFSPVSLLADISDADDQIWFVPDHWRERNQVYPTGLFHRYNLPSMEQEVAHHLVADHPLRGDALVMREGDVFRDLHYHPQYAVESTKAAIARRAYIRKRFNDICRTDVFVMTLGVTEAWYDLTSGLYLNAGPSLPILRASPKRYELRVLDWPTLMGCARRIVAMLTQAVSTMKVIVTVSPIPLDTTFRPANVAVATMQSKSTLVAVATQLAAENPSVDYFPSYEMAMLSERSSVWELDQRHVKMEFVAKVMSWFTTNYFPEMSTTTQLVAINPTSEAV